MNTKTTLEDLEKLLKAGEKEDALIILEAFQGDTLIEYRKWYLRKYWGREPLLYEIHINKFIEETK